MVINENAKRAALIGLFLLGVAGVRWYSSRPSPVSPYLTTSPTVGSSGPVAPPTPLPSFFDSPAQPTSPNPVITQDSSSQNSTLNAEGLNRQTEGDKALGKFYSDERKRQAEQWKRADEAAAAQRERDKYTAELDRQRRAVEKAQAERNAREQEVQRANAERQRQQVQAELSRERQRQLDRQKRP